MALDVLIRNGKIVDGSGNPWFTGDVGIVGERIAAVGRLDGAEAALEVDATGLVVAPGFVDIHGHGDMMALLAPEVRPKALQGVTTEVGGSCGITAFPVPLARRDLIARHYGFIFQEARTWQTLEDYFREVEAQGVGINVGAHVGHGALRMAVLGDVNRPPTPDELEQMKSLLAQALEQGAVGMSTGLIFAPSSYGDTEELVELAKVLARYDRLYASHIRGERETLMEAVREAIAIGERSGARVEVSHVEAVGRPNWGRMPDELRLLEQARERGVNVAFDVFPYRGSPVRLFNMIPVWAREGGALAARERMKDPEARRRILAEAPPQDWEKILVTKYAGPPGGPEWWGRSIADLAQEHGKTPLDFACDLQVTDPDLIITDLEMLSESDLRAALAHPLAAIITDATYEVGGLLHPRVYSAFAEVLARYVRDERVLSLEEAIRKMTWAPAQRVGFWDVGLIRPGMRADLVVFDLQGLRSKATFANPEQHPEGFIYLFVNGQVTVEEGLYRQAMAGRVMRHPGQPVACQ
ncbi:MAG: N-acyl-D-amino-acid deacylase family protein [Anaerolineae bacterium]